MGLSVNLTPQLTSEGKCILIFNMFAGRVGLLSLLLALRRPIEKAEGTEAEKSCEEVGA